MNRRRYARTLASILVFATLGLVPAQASAGERLIVRTSGLLTGLPVVKSACALVGCNVLYGLDGALGKLFLVAVPDALSVPLVINLLDALPGIEVEIDQVVYTEGSAVGTSAPLALYDKDPVNYYGTVVRGGYVRQPATEIVGVLEAHRTYGVTGRDITVAVIDTGVDPHPALAHVLLPGYDFTRNRDGGSEQSDVNQSTMAILDGQPGFVNQSTMAILDQSTMAILDGPEYAAFGHGTMVAGVVHLTAPRARILPLKAFKADGSGYASDVLRAIYTAVSKNADILNMSFSFSTRSRELESALTYATARGVVAVASTGNDGQRVNKYPAALSTVIGVASTTDWDTLSYFSNYGPSTAWIAAPGEAIVSTYPFGSYAAAWGTSFSTPFAAGTAALLIELNGRITPAQAADAEGQGVRFSDEVQKGRLYIPSALHAGRPILRLW
jgi:subtilisin family serine protease